MPFLATSGSTVSFGSTAVEANTSVSSSRYWAPASSCVPKVSCVRLPVAGSTRNSFSLPLTRVSTTIALPSGVQVGA